MVEFICYAHTQSVYSVCNDNKIKFIVAIEWQQFHVHVPHHNTALFISHFTIYRLKFPYNNHYIMRYKLVWLIVLEVCLGAVITVKCMRKCVSVYKHQIQTNKTDDNKIEWWCSECIGIGSGKWRWNKSRERVWERQRMKDWAVEYESVSKQVLGIQMKSVDGAIEFTHSIDSLQSKWLKTVRFSLKPKPK